MDVCPTLCLKLVSAGQLAGDSSLDVIGPNTVGGDAWREGSAIIKDETRCIRCANCADRCPTGAITMEQFCFQEHMK